ncbi:hypothetical protein IAG44_24105 [Streptomyces roseirectus]|uniref:DUF5753 domain-containing protein n=1 Tax=Streptomyces roseirectus TaxID=2768066 RepID=A0A7H0IHC6_9ACTN|nr:Scr1 family TA system antitoxin-like transcriptional regulator [Streptomyces roseirectus]QNP72192.1 hypothetical protein IAG44_24105 [Streptomyces roseirectus]
MDPLLSFEDVAQYEHVFANALVPGLLQTPRHMLAVASPAWSATPR